ncbi:MAG: VWA domain-containing protein [Rhodomicrobium sp.]|nr:VWA domain-containing protein [Rhodomicrobium sp.]
MSCDLRLNSKVPDEQLRVEERKFSQVRVEWPDGQAETHSLSRYINSGDKPAWLILIDQSGSLQKPTVDRIKTDLKNVVGNMGNDAQIGIATFSRDFKLLAPIGSSRAELSQKLDGFNATGAQTYLYKSVKTALGEFRSLDKEDRKALVVISDGREEDPDKETWRREAIKEAKEKGVVIYSIAYVQSPGETADFAGMRELAESTGGPYRQANLAQGAVLLSETYSERFYEFLVNGGGVEFPLRTLENDGTVRFSVSAIVEGADGLSDLKRPVILAYTGPKISEGLIARIVGIFQKVFGKTAGPIVLIALILVILALIALAIYVLFFRSRGHDSDFALAGAGGGTVGPDWDFPRHDTAGVSAHGDMATSILSPRSSANAGEVYGWLEVMSSGERIPLNQTGMRIGRHEDNDIRFDASTVHRRHAVVHMTPQRDFIITDLSGTDGNGVQVNSVRVERAELKDGDIVQLGEVRVKFHAATV